MARAARFRLRTGILGRTRLGGNGVADGVVAGEERVGRPSLSLGLRSSVMVVKSPKWKGREMMPRWSLPWTVLVRSLAPATSLCSTRSRSVSDFIRR